MTSSNNHGPWPLVTVFVLLIVGFCVVFFAANVPPVPDPGYSGGVTYVPPETAAATAARPTETASALNVQAVTAQLTDTYVPPSATPAPTLTETMLPTDTLTATATFTATPTKTATPTSTFTATPMVATWTTERFDGNTDVLVEFNGYLVNLTQVSDDGSNPGDKAPLACFNPRTGNADVIWSRGEPVTGLNVYLASIDDAGAVVDGPRPVVATIFEIEQPYAWGPGCQTFDYVTTGPAGLGVFTYDRAKQRPTRLAYFPEEGGGVLSLEVAAPADCWSVYLVDEVARPDGNLQLFACSTKFVLVWNRADGPMQANLAPGQGVGFQINGGYTFWAGMSDNKAEIVVP